jgi:hypothetical protein
MLGAGGFAETVVMRRVWIPDRLRWHLVVAAGLAVVLYAVGFAWIEHRRVRNGPWEIQFQPEEVAHQLVLQIRQSRLGLDLIEVVLPWPGDQPLPAAERVRFDQARAVPFAVPGGRCVFQDLLFLPGAVVLDLQGTTIELLPRVLRIDGREIPWHPPRRVEVQSITSQPVGAPATR